MSIEQDTDDRGDPIVKCRFCDKWFSAGDWDEHEYYCSGRAADEEYLATSEEESGVMDD